MLHIDAMEKFLYFIRIDTTRYKGNENYWYF